MMTILSKANYRPVTVLPAINNIFEGILAAQLNAFIALCCLISYWARIRSSTAVRRRFYEWQRSGGQCVMMGHSFDVIQHPLLLAKLKAYWFNKDSCALLRDYLSNRQQIGDTFSSWETVKRGVIKHHGYFPSVLKRFITMYNTV